MYADKDVTEKYGMALPDTCTEMQLSNDGKSLYLLYGEPGKIQEYSLERNVLGKTFDAGEPLDGMTVRSGSGQIFAIENSKKKLLIINPATMTLDRELPLQKTVHGITSLGGPNDYVMLIVSGDGEKTRALLVGNPEIASGGDTGIELPRAFAVYGSNVNSRWVVFSGVNPDNEHHVLRAYHIESLMRELGDWSAVRQKTTKQNEWQPKLEAMAKKLSEIELNYELPERMERGEGGPPMLADNDRILMGRRAYKIGDKNLEPDTEFEANPALDKTDMEDGQSRLLRWADTLHTVTNDGKYAASMSHIYHTGTGKIMKKIPFICSDPTFSNDGKGLCPRRLAPHAVPLPGLGELDVIESSAGF